MKSLKIQKTFNFDRSNYQMPKINFKNLLQNFKYHTYTSSAPDTCSKKFSIGSFGSQNIL